MCVWTGIIEGTVNKAHNFWRSSFCNCRYSFRTSWRSSGSVTEIDITEDGKIRKKSKHYQQRMTTNQLMDEPKLNPNFQNLSVNYFRTNTPIKAIRFFFSFQISVVFYQLVFLIFITPTLYILVPVDENFKHYTFCHYNWTNFPYFGKKLQFYFSIHKILYSYLKNISMKIVHYWYLRVPEFAEYKPFVVFYNLWWLTYRSRLNVYYNCLLYVRHIISQML